MHKVFTILVTYNSTKWLDQVFGTLKAEDLLQNTIVIDNKSSDGTPEIIAQKWPEVSLVRSDENLGFGAGNNLGISMALAAGADFCFLLNHDAWPIKGSIQAITKALDKNPTWGIVSPLHLQSDEQTPDQLFARYLTQADTTFQAVVNSGKSLPVPFVNAAAWIIPRRTIEKIGGFSPLFYHYGEDRDYAERLRYHDLKMVVVPSYTIVHDRGTRPQGWKLAPDRQLNSFEIGLLQRLANPNGTALSRILKATSWWLGNLQTALGAGYFSVVPAALKMLGPVVVEHHKRAVVRTEVRKVGQHFIAP